MIGRPPSPPRVPGRFPVDDLWRRLSRAQDQAVDGETAHPTSRRLPLRHTKQTFPGAVSLRRLRGGYPRGGIVALAAAAAVILVALVVHKAPLSFQLGRTAKPGTVGRALMADAREDLPLQFSDGSAITFRAGAAGRMQRLTDRGAEVVLERGQLEAHVVHAESTLWLVHAGPFRVRVTGTRFTVGWMAAAAKLEVAVYEGSVVIDGAPLGAGVPLGAGRRLTVHDGVVRTEALTDDVRRPNFAAGSTSNRASNPASTGAADQGPAPIAPSPSHEGDWLAFAEAGDYSQAFSAAKRIGWGRLCGRLDARRLLMLGDVARYAGAQGDASHAFKSLVARFSNDRLAADAVFSLGRLTFESGWPGDAAHWFKRYVDDWPNGPLADQALGRLMECTRRTGDHAGAANAAKTYLARAPNGPHSALARDILGPPPSGQP